MCKETEILPNQFYVALKPVCEIPAILRGIRGLLLETGCVNCWDNTALAADGWMCTEALCGVTLARKQNNQAPQRKNASQRHFVHHTSHMYRSGMETGPLRLDAGDQLPYDKMVKQTDLLNVLQQMATVIAFWWTAQLLQYGCTSWTFKAYCLLDVPTGLTI